MVVGNIIAALPLSTSIHVRAQTLYEVSQSLTTTAEIVAESIFISAGGVGADGATTYVEVGVESSILEIDPTKTVSDRLNPPITFTETFAAHPSVFRLSESLPAGIHVQTCTFSVNGHGTCAGERPKFGSGTLSETFSGAVVPFYTLAAHCIQQASRHSAASADIAVDMRLTGLITPPSTSTPGKPSGSGKVWRGHAAAVCRALNARLSTLWLCELAISSHQLDGCA
ncbi:hypothetical protein C8R44DRAFT_889301 [Mycena epipterygia]|nr:hypothetical protein C8R44DRAFT_889301 [Mycena epipterygia]